MNTKNKNLMASRAKLLLVFFLFLGPLCAAFIWYYGLGASLVPKSQSNNAPLIVPVVSLTAFENDSHFSDVVNFSSLQKKWTIVHLLGSDCDELCKQALYNTRQTRIALGKDSHRIQRIIILSDSKFAKEVEYNHADAFILKPQTNGIEQQLQPIIVKAKALINDAILIDPLGNAMMIIPIDLEPRLILKDLKKLLKLSRVG